jgi:hypothetical protein
MPLTILPAPPSCASLVERLRSLAAKRRCPRLVEVLVLRMGQGFDVSVSHRDDPTSAPGAPFLPLNSTRWSSPMSEGNALLAFEDWAASGYPR